MTAKGLSLEWWQVWNCVSQWRASPGLAPHWFRKAWMSRCTSERPPEGPGGSGGAGGGNHDCSFAAREWASSSEPTASSSAGGAGALAVLSRRPGLVPLAARRRVLLLSLRAPPFPPGLRSLPPVAVVRRAQANRAVAMTTKPARPPRSDNLLGALGSGGALNLRGVAWQGARSRLCVLLKRVRPWVRGRGPQDPPPLWGTAPNSKGHVAEIKGGGTSLICCQGWFLERFSGPRGGFGGLRGLG